MPIRRPCIERLEDGRGCPNFAEPGKSRCAEHELEHMRNRVRTPSSQVCQTHRWRKLRASVIAKRRKRDGTWRCEICGEVIDDGLIEVDHEPPVGKIIADGGDPYDESFLRIAHRRCNRAAGAKLRAKSKPRRKFIGDY